VDSYHLQDTITNRSLISFGGLAGSSVQISVRSRGPDPVVGCPSGGSSATLALAIDYGITVDANVKMNVALRTDAVQCELRPIHVLHILGGQLVEHGHRFGEVVDPEDQQPQS
jgi:hypothetical protein